MLSPSDIRKAIDTINREHEFIAAIVTPESYCVRGGSDGSSCKCCDSSQSCETNIKELFHQYVYSSLVHFERELNTMSRAGIAADHVEQHQKQHERLSVIIGEARDRFATTHDRCEAISSLKEIARSIDDHIETADAEMFAHLEVCCRPGKWQM